MRIGLFTDTYHPALNGIVYVIDIVRKQLEAEGHEAFVYCPEIYSGRNGNKQPKEERDPNVIRFRAIESGFFDDFGIAVFFPPRELRRIKALELDVIIFFTPGQIGFMGVYAAKKLGLPLITQHSTDVYGYVEHYPAMLPGMVALSATLPFTIKMDGKDTKEWLRSFMPKRKLTQWGKHAVERLVTLLYQKCDAVVVLSRKSLNQLSGWEGGQRVNFELIPTGVDPLLVASKAEVSAFRLEHGIAEDEKVLLYAGRISAEKNLEILIPTIEKVLAKEPKAKLLFVGDFEYREVLEARANESSASDNIIFAGRMPREKLGVAYAAADVFVFPSLKDTQGLVLAEAALAGLPIVLVDEPVSEVVYEGVNGLVAENSSDSIAEMSLKLLKDDKLRKSMSVQGVKVASEYSESKQTKKLIKLCEKMVVRRQQDVIHSRD
jgi:glycosyltransferase involved in cell wall biosynthesis